MSQQDRTRPRQPIQAMFTGPGPNLNLPTLFGKENHDPRSKHRKYPAWHFGIKHGKVHDDCSPGPVYYPDPKIYKNGPDGTPQYSLYGRTRDVSMFRTPGPGTYNPGNDGSQVPGVQSAPRYSFGTRHAYRQRDCAPAANAYTLPSMTGHTVVSGKKSAPIISLGGRTKTGGFHEDLAKTPGAGSYSTVEPSTYRKKQPSYSMTGRNTMPGDSTQKPGPGAYSPEMVYVNKKCAPKFSFGSRHSEYIAPLIIEASD